MKTRSSIVNRLGEKYKTNFGRNITIVDYENAHKVTVQFDDGFTKVVEMGNIKKGAVAHKDDYKIPPIGSRWKSKAYGYYTVVEYHNAYNVIIEFDAPYTCRIRTESRSVKRGEVKNPLIPDKDGFFFGIGNFDSHAKSYKIWTQMKRRCGNRNKRSVAYTDCTVCEEWKNYQNFAEWYCKQIGAEKTGWHLDKDILIKGNRVYGPDVCCLVPAHINTTLTKRKAERGDYPIGVVIDNTGKPSCQYTENGEHVWRGYFTTVEEAFAVYKEAKELHIKSLAEKWKNDLDPRVYKALMNYVVEITD